MYVELTTGKDSFRAQGGSARRNVQVNTHVRVKDDGEGRKVVPVFAAYQKKLRGFKETSMFQTIPATAAHGPEVAGSWYVNRHEMLPGTEILIEYKHRDPHEQFSDATEYMLLLADNDAPLWRMRLELPRHHLSNVPFVFFQGRFEIIKSDDMLSAASLEVWHDYFALDDDLCVQDVLDPNNPDHKFFVSEELEARVRSRKKVERVETSDGKGRIKVKRTRAIKTRK